MRPTRNNFYAKEEFTGSEESRARVAREILARNDFNVNFKVGNRSPEVRNRARVAREIYAAATIA